jgi:HlyD family secretion protein
MAARAFPPFWRRLILGLAVGGLIVVGLVWAFWPRPVPVDLATVTDGPLAVAVTEEGRTRVTDLYVVSAPVAGRLLRIDAEVGDPVDADATVLATIRPTDPAFLDPRTVAEARALVRSAEAERDLAIADLARAEAERAYAEAELGRSETLADRGTISEATLEQRQMAFDTRRAAVAQARAALRVAQAQLDTARAALIQPGQTEEETAETCCVRVRAPVDGRVLRLLHESEGIVAAGTPLVEVGDPGDLEIVVELLSADAVRVEVGDRATIDGWGGPTLDAVVRRVEPFGFTEVSALGIEEQRVNVILDLTGDPVERRGLGHGYRVDAAITVWRADAVTSVPLGALFRQGDDWAVFRVADGRARLTRIAIGQRNPDRVQVVEGLSPGDKVVLHPGEEVGDGMRVEARRLE